MIDLYQGDCLEVMKQIPDKSVDMILCDLPYGTTVCKWDIPIPFDKLWSFYDRIIKDKGNIVLFSKQPFSTELNYSNFRNFRYEIIWCKQQATNPLCAKKRIMPIHENISIFYKELGTFNPQMFYGGKSYKAFCGNKKIGEVYGKNKSKHRDCKDGSRYPTSVLYFNNVRKTLHPTQKPVALCEYLIKTYTNEGDLVLDNCMGSGTTGVACKHLNRNFIGIELDEKYFQIAKDRIEGGITMIWTDKEIVEWHKKTFPDCTAKDQADKVGEEIHELIMAFVNEESKERISEEIADVYIASLVLEKRFGIKTSLFLSRLGKEDSIKKKMDENAKRTWVKVNGVYRHKDIDTDKK